MMGKISSFIFSLNQLLYLPNLLNFSTHLADVVILFCNESRLYLFV